MVDAALFDLDGTLVDSHLTIAEAMVTALQSFGYEIDVPTLLVSGRHDEATPLIVGQIHDSMLLDVAELGNDLEWLPMRAVGATLVIHDVTVSGS